MPEAVQDLGEAMQIRNGIDENAELHGSFLYQEFWPLHEECIPIPHMKARTLICLGFSVSALALVSGCAETPFGKSNTAKNASLVKPQDSDWDGKGGRGKGGLADKDGDVDAEDVGAEGVSTQSLHVSGQLAKACGIKETGPAQASFEFDSVTLSDSDRGVLTEIAKCMTMGALRGKKVSLVGRADPRGEDEYNMTLGSARAASVYEYLHDLGVAPEQVKPTSRGEMDATGTDEAGWSQDRRVDIEEL